MIFCPYTLLFCNVGEQSHNSRTLDSLSEKSLVLCANAAHTSGNDLALFGDELTQFCNVLVIDLGSLVYAEGANLFAGSLGASSLLPDGEERNSTSSAITSTEVRFAPS